MHIEVRIDDYRAFVKPIFGAQRILYTKRLINLLVPANVIPPLMIARGTV